LRHRRLLLVLGKCGNGLDGRARLAESLLQSCPRLRVLAPSRPPLGIFGAAGWRPAPPPLPGPRPAAAAEDIAALDATPPVTPPPSCLLNEHRTTTLTGGSAIGTRATWPACADAWTVCRWRSNWLLPAFQCSRSRASPAGSTIDSGCSRPGVARH